MDRDTAITHQWRCIAHVTGCGICIGFVLQPDMLLEDVYKRMIVENINILPVYRGDTLIGAVDKENILEYVMIKNARQ